MTQTMRIALSTLTLARTRELSSVTLTWGAGEMRRGTTRPSFPSIPTTTSTPCLFAPMINILYVLVIIDLYLTSSCVDDECSLCILYPFFPLQVHVNDKYFTEFNHRGGVDASSFFNIVGNLDIQDVEYFEPLVSVHDSYHLSRKQTNEKFKI